MMGRVWYTVLLCLALGISMPVALQLTEEPPVLPVSERQYYDHPRYAQYLWEGDGGISKRGVTNCFWGRLETYYSSNVLYHKRTGDWWVDGEEFYRTAEGYYVVAASDMPKGTVFLGSKGPCQVLDCGCAPGITDYYVRDFHK